MIDKYSIHFSWELHLVKCSAKPALKLICWICRMMLKIWNSATASRPLWLRELGFAQKENQTHPGFKELKRLWKYGLCHVYGYRSDSDFFHCCCAWHDVKALWTLWLISTALYYAMCHFCYANNQSTAVVFIQIPQTLKENKVSEHIYDPAISYPARCVWSWLAYGTRAIRRTQSTKLFHSPKTPNGALVLKLVQLIYTSILPVLFCRDLISGL